mgnify:CR=1 FL=1
MAQSRIPLMEVDEAKIRLVMDNSIDVLMANTEVAQRAALGPNPFERPAITKLAVSLLTSHSQGAGSVSSRSLMEKMTFLSGVANPPKLHKWASPHACTNIPELGVLARSADILKAEPR